MKERSGQGATRGRSHPVCAVGGGVRALESGARSGARDALHAQSRDPRLNAGDTEFPAAEAGATPAGVEERSPGTREKPPTQPS